MASFTLTATQTFPEGTVVGAYPRTAWPSTSPPTGAPAGAATATATMTNGVATFSGLADDTAYRAAAQVSGAWVTSAFRTPVLSAQSSVESVELTADNTLVIGDAGKIVRVNLDTAVVVTVPPESSVAFALGTVVNVRRVGAGSVTITPGAGVTIPNRVQTSGAAGRTVANQFGEAALHKVATNVWELVGDIA